MIDTYIEAKGELSGEMKPAPRKKRNPLRIVSNILLVFVLVCGLGMAAFMIGLRIVYSDTCFVNGTSMYPTLNSGARKEGKSDLKFFEERNGSLAFLPSDDGDLVDFGFMDGKENTLNSLKRFDIVVTYFQSDWDPATESFVGSPKVKRLIGLPGEKITLTPDSSPMGKLRINGEVVPQPGNSFENYNAPLKAAGLKISYPASNDPRNNAEWQYDELTLGEDEFYVCGDNRYGASSNDSRREGPITRSCIQGRMMSVIGLCRLDGGTCKWQFDGFKMPWNWES